MHTLFPLVQTLLAFSNGSNKGATSYQTVDVAVVGSGFSGLAAAIEAANSGATSITILEKMPSPGGKSIYNSGHIAAVGTPQQAKADILDSVELMVQDMSTAGLYFNQPPLLEALARSSADTVKWTEKELGVKYRDGVAQLEGHSVPRTLITKNASSKDIIKPMLKKVEDSPSISLKVNTKLQGLVMDESGKRIWGVRVRRTDTNKDLDKNKRNDPFGTDEEIIKCTKGVVLASGGPSTNQPVETSETIQQALKIGASLDLNSPNFQCTGGLHINPKGQIVHVGGYPIEGLYAAGGITGGIHGSGRLLGCSSLESLTFGIIAGRNVMSNANNEKKKIQIEKEIKKNLEMEKFMDAMMMSPYRF
mmetsp:Transcript_18474/g.25421  ORF Transcript_18474/g.25421 Transcript_18474/m.25421 type:complete len:363 (-) Transcript_18474:177-1265(-)|eukprot:CAMPEP_0185726752 /NCGR_PEP_ID=MMETSP1171-20130828/2630_1 /TAXON_ID=374046 /ORGANISM="Helicotheca tamensis, Strain CCMP826" /LENGTH=362 /DNA_ID=CAMNT_0028395159 /DNA_START=107 /DNA_END=1195 /DNA_ORIENTATION=-